MFKRMTTKKKLKVLFVVDANKDTGIYVFANSLAKVLRRKGVDVKIDERGKYDLIHIQNPLPISYLRVKKRHPFTPIVCTTNMTHSELVGIIPKAMTPIAENYLYLFYLACKKIICSSPKIMNELSKLPVISKRRIYLPNGVCLEDLHKDKTDGEKFRKKYKIPEDKKVVLSVATLQKRKGIFDFVKASKKLKNYTFVWVGGIAQLPTVHGKNELKKLMKEKHDNLVFTGFLKRKELGNAYASADVFLFPTYAETFGLVAVEAAHFGLPVIIRDLPEFKMFKFGIKFRNQKSMERKIKKVLENKEKWKKYSEKSLKEADTFSIDSYADEMKEIYEKVI